MNTHNDVETTQPITKRLLPLTTVSCVGIATTSIAAVPSIQFEVVFPNPSTPSVMPGPPMATPSTGSPDLADHPITTATRTIPSRTLSDAIKASRLKPLSPQAEQMLLGTILGDGSTRWTAKHGALSMRHSTKQEAYCRSKFALLADYINTPPKIVNNGGWGDKLCVFSTLTSPVFDFLKEIAYRPNPKAPERLMKWVTPEWLARLTWEGIAWWYMDDGTLATGPTAIFNTHKFPLEQVEMLAQMFRDRGIEAKACPTRKGDKIFYIIRLTVASTRKFVKLIKPFVHPTMAYKIDAPDRILPECAFCGDVVDTRNINWKRPCCRNPECQRERNRERSMKHLNKPGQRAIFNARQKARRDANIEEARRKANLRQRARFADPAYRAKMKAYQHERYLRLRKAGLLPKKKGNDSSKSKPPPKLP